MNVQKELEKSQKQIAVECGCVQGTIEYWMDKFNIKSRPRSKSIKLLYKNGMRPSNLNEIDKLPMDKWLSFLGWYISIVSNVPNGSNRVLNYRNLFFSLGVL